MVGLIDSDRFAAAGMAGGLRASGPKADIALVVADEVAVAAGVFTTNVMCAAPVTYCKQVLSKGQPVKAVSRERAVHRCGSSLVNQDGGRPATTGVLAVTLPVLPRRADEPLHCRA